MIAVKSPRAALSIAAMARLTVLGAIGAALLLSPSANAAPPPTINVTDSASQAVVNSATVGECLAVDTAANRVSRCPSGSTAGTDLVVQVPLGPLAALTCDPGQAEIIATDTGRKLCTQPWPYGSKAP